MKKVLALLLALVSIIGVSLSFGGCGKLETGTFYTVSEAYENGFLTREQVMSIAYYYHEGYDSTQCDEKIISEDFTPFPKSPETLNKKTDKAIKTSFYNSAYWAQYENKRTFDDIGYVYYGTYGNAVAVIVSAGIEGVSTVSWKEEVGDCIIHYRDEKRILVWVKD